ALPAIVYPLAGKARSYEDQVCQRTKNCQNVLHFIKSSSTDNNFITSLPYSSPLFNQDVHLLLE
ncbi:MAG: hypothetical protein Q7U43_18300, partial [Methylococcaceae bacterium]|nr:hypothetical protein [Methylococcaceae bacterium]